MVETQALLSKITALRQRLEQAQSLAHDAGSAAVALLSDQTSPPLRGPTLARRVAEDDEHDEHLDSMIRPLTAVLHEDRRPLPRQITARARRVLERGRELLGQLRALADSFVPPGVLSMSLEVVDVPQLDRSEPLAVLYRETVAMADVSLRMIPLFPDAATAQLQMCEGLEGILHAVAGRLRVLNDGVGRHRREHERVAALAEMFTAVLAGEKREPKPFVAIAEEILADAIDGGPLRFAPTDVAQPARFAAGQGINTARVVARLVRHHEEWKQRPLDAVMAGLIHDAGMARVPADVLMQTGPLSDEQRRTVEAHCRAAAELAAVLWPQSAWLALAVLSHHERLDGTGFPGGLRDSQIPSLARLITVSDVFVAMCTPRPHRPTRESRTALTDTLLLAEQGLFDRKAAELLLQLSFYPVGTAVELGDGSVGVVVATPSTWRDLNSPARPVVAVLLDPEGHPLSAPRHVDLMRTQHHSVLRSLPPKERRERIGAQFPEWA